MLQFTKRIKRYIICIKNDDHLRLFEELIRRHDVCVDSSSQLLSFLSCFLLYNIVKKLKEREEQADSIEDNM